MANSVDQYTKKLENYMSEYTRKLEERVKQLEKLVTPMCKNCKYFQQYYVFDGCNYKEAYGGVCKNYDVQNKSRDGNSIGCRFWAVK